MASTRLVEKYILMDEEAVRRTLTRVAYQILEDLGDLSDVLFVGIRTRGEPLARRLASRLEDMTGKRLPVGGLDITFYRDDLSMVAEKPVVKGTDLPVEIQDRRVILVDDVLYTGRTVRAALEALIHFGRPRAVFLFCLIDRGWRELPICANWVGRTITTTASEVVKVKLRETDGEDAVVIAERIAS